MSLFVSSLNSGSNGNCYYIGNHDEAILVDAGISCKEVEKRMNRLGLCMSKVKALFISHEHTDHIKGVTGLVKKFQLPVYVTSATMRGCHFPINQQVTRNFNIDQPTTIGTITVTAFSKHHDAADPCSFTISCGETTVGVFTDIGKPCKNLIKNFQQCHAAFLEANYDEEMLHNGSYPYHLKLRIRGGKGHLSNTQALELFNTSRSINMTHLFLSHLSSNNNCPTLVGELFNAHARGVHIVVASRYQETPVYEIVASGSAIQPVKTTATTAQLAFAFA